MLYYYHKNFTHTIKNNSLLRLIKCSKINPGGKSTEKRKTLILVFINKSN